MQPLLLQVCKFTAANTRLRELTKGITHIDVDVVKMTADNGGVSSNLLVNLLGGFIMSLEQNELKSINFAASGELQQAKYRKIKIMPPTNFASFMDILRLSIIVYAFQKESMKGNSQLDLIWPLFGNIDMEVKTLTATAGPVSEESQGERKLGSGKVKANQYEVDNVDFTDSLYRIRANQGHVRLVSDNLEYDALGGVTGSDGLLSEDDITHMLEKHALAESDSVYIHNTISSTLLPARTQLGLLYMISRGDVVLFVKELILCDFDVLDRCAPWEITAAYLRSVESGINSAESAKQLSDVDIAGLRTRDIQLSRMVYCLNFNYFQNVYDFNCSTPFRSLYGILEGEDSKSLYQNYYVRAEDLSVCGNCINYFRDAVFLVMNFPGETMFIRENVQLLLGFLFGIAEVRVLITNSPLLQLVNRCCRQETNTRHNMEPIAANPAILLQYLSAWKNAYPGRELHELPLSLGIAGRIVRQQSFEYRANNCVSDITDTVLDGTGPPNFEFIHWLANEAPLAPRVEFLSGDIVCAAPNVLVDLVDYALHHYAFVCFNGVYLPQLIYGLAENKIHADELVINAVPALLKTFQRELFKQGETVDQSHEHNECVATDTELPWYMCKETVKPGEFLRTDMLCSKILENMKEREQRTGIAGFQSLVISGYFFGHMNPVQADGLLHHMQAIHDIAKYERLIVDNNNLDTIGESETLRSNFERLLGFCVANGIKFLHGVGYSNPEFVFFSSLIKLINGYGTRLLNIGYVNYQYTFEVLSRFRDQIKDQTRTIIFENNNERDELFEDSNYAQLLSLFQGFGNVRHVGFISNGLENNSLNVRRISEFLRQFASLESITLDENDIQADLGGGLRRDIEVLDCEYRFLGDCIVKIYPYEHDIAE